MEEMGVTVKSIIEDIAKYSKVEGFEYTEIVPNDETRFIILYSGIHALAELLGIDVEE